MLARMSTKNATVHVKKQKSLEHRPASERNKKLYDKWSLAHFVTGIVFGWIMPPVVAIILMILWEPLEIEVLSRIFAHYDIDFGFEALRNSLSDIVFDAAGVAVGYYGLLMLVHAPFRLF